MPQANRVFKNVKEHISDGIYSRDPGKWQVDVGLGAIEDLGRLRGTDIT